MTTSPDELIADKNSIIEDMFRTPADHNYIIARWCFQQKMYREFYWNASQALEKYMKASLLSNNRSAIESAPQDRYGHNLEALLTSVQSFTECLIPADLPCPPRLEHAGHWKTETTPEFIGRINGIGDPNNRYNVFGFASDWGDIFKLDQVIFWLRRVSFNLDSPIAIPSGTNIIIPTIRQQLQTSETYMPAVSKLRSLVAKLGPDVHNVLMEKNLLWAPEDHDHASFTTGFNMAHPSLYIRILRPMESMEPDAKSERLANLADWVINHIYLPQDTRTLIRDARTRLRP